MSETAARRRIRAQASARDPNVMGFLLDAPVQGGRSARLKPTDDAPLARALYAVEGVARVETADAAIWIGKTDAADWAALKPAVAAAIRETLDATDAPLGRGGPAGCDDPDAALLDKVRDLLDRQVNPSVAAHGGRIEAERVENGAVHLRMSGGCQGCAASSATLREGVERMLRAALPELREIVDVTDHAAGSNPFYARDRGPSPALFRPIPADVIRWEGGDVSVDPDYLAPKLGLTPKALREGLRDGRVSGVTEIGHGADAGKARIVMRAAGRAWAAEVSRDGPAREIPPPRDSGAAAAREIELAARARAYLESLSPSSAPIAYGALARALGLWTPGAVKRVTRALETTMRQDVAAGRPFIAARAVGRGRDGLPGPGFFELSRKLSRGPKAGEDERAFFLREAARLEAALAEQRAAGAA